MQADMAAQRQRVWRLATVGGWPGPKHFALVWPMVNLLFKVGLYRPTMLCIGLRKKNANLSI